MPRFSAAFSRRKSTADDVQNAMMMAPEQSSFRVMERSDAAGGKSFDGGARLARASGTPIARPSHLETDQDDNMFANLRGDRGSGVSNSTKATSTDNSSRHSNASTTPSSADMAPATAHDNFSKKNLHDVPGRRGVTSSGSAFLSKAGRTFSFGTKKAPAPASPDVPPIPTIQREDETGRARGLTNSTMDSQTTTTPPRLGESESMDLGGDFATMFSGSGFDKRASAITLKNANHSSPQPVPQKQPTTLQLDSTSRVESGPKSWHSEHSNDGLLRSRSPPFDEPGPPVPRHQHSFETRPVDYSPDAPDEESKLLQDTLAAARFISTVDERGPAPSTRPYKSEQESFTVLPRRTMPSVAASQEDNIFAGSPSRISRQPNRQVARPTNQTPQNKVMTPAEFERYRRHKEQLGTAPDSHGPAAAAAAAAADDDDDDDINYDDEEDDAEKAKQQAKQRRKQEAHMSVYRQQMMKVTGEPAPTPPTAVNRPSVTTSLSAPALANFQSPSPDLSGADDDDDEEVPLAILQAHGFPHKNRAPSRLTTAASNPNLRASSQASGRPGSSLGEPSGNRDRQRHSTLPAFARGLPQDPFVGASVSRPAVRESLAFGGGAPAPPPQQQGALPPGGLVGVIASEERSRALRRGSPNMESNKFTPSPNFQGSGVDPMASIPPQMMYGQAGIGGMPGMPQMPGQLTAGDQAQIQMTQQMQQFMQMQMQFMQMMAGSPGGQPQMQMQPPGQGPYMGGPPTQSQADLSGRQSVMGDSERPRMNGDMRTMSMVQPHTGTFGPAPGYAPSFQPPAPGYTPSIAPSERSNVGLPGRYRPVSQAPASTTSKHSRSNTMSGALSQFGDEKKKSSMNIIHRPSAGSDDDDEEGWEAMKAKREKKRSLWRNKKDFAGVLDAVM